MAQKSNEGEGIRKFQANRRAEAIKNAVDVEVQSESHHNEVVVQEAATPEATTLPEIQAPKPFNPHSVASIQTVEEQLKSLEMRDLLARGGKIPPESVVGPDVDIRSARAPQYATRQEMQKEMDAWAEGSTEPKPAPMEQGNPWGRGGAKRGIFREQFLSLYPPNKEGIHDAKLVSEADWRRYEDLAEEQQRNFAAGDTVAEDATLEKIAHFLLEPKAPLEPQVPKASEPMVQSEPIGSAKSKSPRKKRIPSELAELYHDGEVPENILENYRSLRGPVKKASYIVDLQKEIASVGPQLPSSPIQIIGGPIDTSHQDSDALPGAPTSSEGLRQEPLYWSKFEAYDDINAMYGGLMPSDVRDRYREIADKIYATEPDSSERGPVLEEMQSFKLAQWEATRNNRANAASIDYATWAQQFERFEDQLSHHRSELKKILDPNDTTVFLPDNVARQLAKLNTSYIEALNADDEGKMAEIAADADAFVEEQRAQIEAQETAPADIAPSVLRFRPGHERIIPPSSNPAEEESDTPDTPKGWKDKLRGLITKAVAETKEDVNWWKSAKEGLIRRSADLDARAEKIGGFEKFFRKMGEGYNKLGWKSKLAVGAGLGIGTAASSVFMFPTALALCVTGLVAQRTAGLMTMYLKFEKEMPYQEKVGKLLGVDYGSKEKAMAKAMLYSAAMTGATMLAIKEMKEVFESSAVQEWLRDHWPGGQQATGVSSKGAVGAFEQQPQVSRATLDTSPAPAPAAAVIEAVQQGPVEAASPRVEADALDQASKQSLAEATEPTATEAPPNESLVGDEVSGISVEATKGKGYEYMLKRLWEKSVEMGLKPEDYPKGSDLRALLEADSASIDKTVHNLATDNEYFKETGRSVQVNLGDKMTIDTKGHIWMNDETILAEKDAGVTAPYHPEVPAVPEPPAHVGPESIPYFEQPIENPVTGQSTPDAVLASSNGSETMTDETNYSDKMPATPPEVTPETPTINSHGVELFTNKPHFYAGPKGETIIFGGTPTEQYKLVEEYLKANPKSEIIGTNNSNTINPIRIKWSLVPGEDGKSFVGGVSVEPKGLLSAFLPKGPPSAEELRKLIK